MGTITTITGSMANMPEELINDIFSKVQGHSSLAKLSTQIPVPFAGTEEMTFSLDNEVSIVGEGENKPPHGATWGSVVIRPIKMIYQHRLTDEFVYMSEEQQLPYLAAFTDGFAKKIASKVIFMDDGVICEMGTPDEVFHHPTQERTRQFLGNYAGTL